jgi:hypothetical protein
MFRIKQDPSSGSIDSYLIKTTRSGSTVLVVCALGVWRHIQDLWCVCALRRSRTAHASTQNTSQKHKHMQPHNITAVFINNAIFVNNKHFNY